MTVFSTPYIRMFLKKNEWAPFEKAMAAVMNGVVEFSFDHAPTESTVYAVRSDAGLYSVVVTDKVLDDVFMNTRETVVVDDLKAFVEECRAAGMAIVEEVTPVPGVGFQARIAVSLTNIFEVTQWNQPMGGINPPGWKG